VRYRPARIDAAWLVASTKQRGVETASYLLRMSDGLSASGVWLKALSSRDDAPATIVLDDAGRGQTGSEAADRLNRGEQVLALDLALLGEAWSERETRRLQQNLNGWVSVRLDRGRRTPGGGTLAFHALRFARPRLESKGIRSQVVVLVAAALEPTLFSEIVVRYGMTSLRHALDKPVEYLDAPTSSASTSTRTSTSTRSRRSPHPHACADAACGRPDQASRRTARAVRRGSSGLLDALFLLLLLFLLLSLLRGLCSRRRRVAGRQLELDLGPHPAADVDLLVEDQEAALVTASRCARQPATGSWDSRRGRAPRRRSGRPPRRPRGWA
jgi:hypothetical protein